MLCASLSRHDAQSVKTHRATFPIGTRSSNSKDLVHVPPLSVRVCPLQTPVLRCTVDTPLYLQIKQKMMHTFTSILLMTAMTGVAAEVCRNLCWNSWGPVLDSQASNGVCQDGGPGSEFSSCPYGSDCADCGCRDCATPEEKAASAFWGWVIIIGCIVGCVAGGGCCCYQRDAIQQLVIQQPPVQAQLVQLQPQPVQVVVPVQPVAHVVGHRVAQIVPVQPLVAPPLASVRLGQDDTARALQNSMAETAATPRTLAAHATTEEEGDQLAIAIAESLALSNG